MTLIELLATVIISVMIAGVITYLISGQVNFWNAMIPASNAKSNATFVMERCQTLFQDVAKITPNSSDPAPRTSITGTDAFGDTVTISVRPINSSGPVGIVVDVMPAPGKSQSVIHNAPYIFNGVTFSGTTFSVSGSTVTVNLSVTDTSGSNYADSMFHQNHTYQVTQQFVVGGTANGQ
jgi:hypothetical protein